MGMLVEARLANLTTIEVAPWEDRSAFDKAVGTNSRKIWLSVLLSILKSEKTLGTFIWAHTWGPPEVLDSPAHIR